MEENALETFQFLETAKFQAEFFVSGGGVCFAADAFGGADFLGGPSYSRTDALVALLSGDFPVSVVSRECATLAGWTSQYKLSRPDWHVIPAARPLAPMLDRTLLSRAVRWCGDAIRDAHFRRRLSRLSPDVLWVEGHMAHRMLESLRDWPARQKVMTIRSSPEQFTGRYTGDHQLDRVLRELEGYDGVISVSSRVGEMWRALPELKGKKIICLPNCAREEDAAVIQQETRAATRARLGLPLDRVVGVCVGNIQFRKGQDLVVAYFDEVRRSLPEMMFVFVGNVMKGRGGGDVVEAAKKKAPDGEIIFTGHQHRSMDFIYAADFLACPSREEAMPLVVLEAMVLGTPVVASNVCGIPELLDDGTEGLLFDPADPEKLAALMIRIGRDAGLRGRLADAAGKKYRNVFAREHHMARYRAAVKELAA